MDEPGGFVPDADPVDELASALLDGDADAPEVPEPALAARMAAFRRVADLVGTPVAPAPPEARDRAIAAAVDAWGRAEPAAGEASVVAELAARRHQRAVRGVRLVGVAAAVLLALVIGGLALRAGSDGDDTTTAAEAPASAPAGAGASGSAGATALAQAAPDLGQFDDVDELLDEAAAFAARTSVAADSATPSMESTAGAAPAPPGTVAGGGNESAADRCARPSTTSQVFFATLEGRSVLVLVLETSDGPRLQVVDVETCELVAER